MNFFWVKNPGVNRVIFFLHVGSGPHPTPPDLIDFLGGVGDFGFLCAKTRERGPPLACVSILIFNITEKTLKL